VRPPRPPAALALSRGVPSRLGPDGGPTDRLTHPPSQAWGRSSVDSWTPDGGCFNQKRKNPRARSPAARGRPTHHSLSFPPPGRRRPRKITRRQHRFWVRSGRQTTGGEDRRGGSFTNLMTRQAAGCNGISACSSHRRERRCRYTTRSLQRHQAIYYPPLSLCHLLPAPGTGGNGRPDGVRLPGAAENAIIVRRTR